MEIPVSEQKMKAREDARILAEANVIHQDQKRFMAATAEAKEMALDKAKEAKAMSEVQRGMYPSMKEGGDGI